MKEVKEHNDKNGCLISIKSVKDTDADRLYFINVISRLSDSVKGYSYFQFSRPNYNVSDIIKELRIIQHTNDKLSCSDDYFECVFVCTEISVSLLRCLSLIWFAFDHCAFCLFDTPSIPLNIDRQSWYYITSMSRSFVVFKGAEDDVVWIGKSNSIEYPLLVDIT
ncbi:hypothetical protein [Deminuibacter soli]|uniref:Uncharacterized protein n=1 Tax=Deminuibacter soli TaxID=2291815 RepID=A0A3E1NJ11_9BACT|nr:hypothetical protein [Deminuibacter soli]RFM27926.1 hypothetical protein DXN05_10285 [Deminuibacter soli]